jgi:hypothetical protein
MDDLVRIWQDLGGRIGGPMSFRIRLQPVMAAPFAIRDGLGDGRANKPPYFGGSATLHPTAGTSFRTAGKRSRVCSASPSSWT